MPVKKSNRNSVHAPGGVVPDRKTDWVSLVHLHLDADNPRFGHSGAGEKDEKKILDRIVEVYGVDDVLSSIAVNGYSEAEPLVGIKRGEEIGDGVVVKEGNRRLSALLILTNDPRAANHRRRIEAYSKRHREYGAKNIDPVPVVVFPKGSDNELLPYLGVRHIAGAQKWDSYAKAAWVAKTVEESGIELESIIHMIGDSRSAAKRMLQAYYLVTQLQEQGYFVPEHSQRKGARSTTDYPFSWVYTALGYRSIMNWLELKDEPQSNPLNVENLEKGGNLLEWMFGQHERAPLLRESRDIKDLGTIIAKPELRDEIPNARSLEALKRKLNPPSENVKQDLIEARERLNSALTPFQEGSIAADEAQELFPLSKAIASLTKNLSDLISRTAAGASE